MNIDIKRSFSRSVSRIRWIIHDLMVTNTEQLRTDTVLEVSSSKHQANCCLSGDIKRTLCSATSGVHNCHVWAPLLRQGEFHKGLLMWCYLLVQLCQLQERQIFCVCVSCMLHTDIPNIYPNLWNSRCASLYMHQILCSLFCEACIWSQSLEHASIYF